MRDEHEMMVDYSEAGVFNLKAKEYEKVKEDYKECKARITKLELFLTSLVNGFQSEYSC